MTQTQEVAQLLSQWRNGDPDALGKLMPLVYDELRHLAHRYVKQQPDGQTLQTTALVHEAYIRLAGRTAVNLQDRSHFFAVCAQVMRNLLIDRARARQAVKRGGGANQVELDEAKVLAPGQDEQLLALDAALERLAAFDSRKSRIVEMRYFGGMSAQEMAEALGISVVTVKREWLKARAWLYREIGESS